MVTLTSHSVSRVAIEWDWEPPQYQQHEYIIKAVAHMLSMGSHAPSIKNEEIRKSPVKYRTTITF
jgi:hypothetical protein